MSRPNNGADLVMPPIALGGVPNTNGSVSALVKTINLKLAEENATLTKQNNDLTKTLLVIMNVLGELHIPDSSLVEMNTNGWVESVYNCETNTATFKYVP